MHFPSPDHKKDPLTRDSDAARRELMRRMAEAGNGMPLEAVLDAAANMVVNALRQSCATRGDAMTAFDALTPKIKAILADQYDSLGRKRGVFAFDQVIAMPHLNFRRPN